MRLQNVHQNSGKKVTSFSEKFEIDPDVEIQKDKGKGSLDNAQRIKDARPLKENKSILNTGDKLIFFNPKTERGAGPPSAPNKIKLISGAKLNVLKQKLGIEGRSHDVQIDLTKPSFSDD